MCKGKVQLRGFNQAELVAKFLANNYTMPYVESLKRIRVTKPMYGLNINDRKINVSGAFVLSTNSKKIVGSRIILIDDVWTTGATMRECAKTLKEVGVGEVWGITLAR
jgi:ComF family protein